jgi:4-amino-4-deoxy-L-arabinose transferase-like glycosyltransferase
MRRRLERVLQDPAAAIGLLAGGQIIAWTLAPSLTHIVPPLDIVEGYMWGREWVIATYKHPALPSWILETTRTLLDATGWPAYLVSQLFVAATFLLVYALGSDLMGRQRGAAGTLLLTGILYYSWTTPEFNHNVVQTTFWAGFAWALWRAVERQSLLWWMILAGFAVAGIYSKLSTGLLFVAAALWVLIDTRARRTLATPGPWIAVGAVMAAAMPLARWLVETDYSMLRYAAIRSYWIKSDSVYRFVASAIGAIAGMLPILAVAGLLGGRRTSADPAPHPHGGIDQRAMRFLIVLIAVPPILLIVIALLTQTGLRAGWASSMFNLTGLLAIALTAGRFDARALERIAAVALCLVVVVPVAYAITLTIPVRTSKMPLRVLWPGDQIAERMAAIWDRATDGAPLNIVAGENWVAGLVGYRHKNRPHLLSNAILAQSPWITSSQLEADGMLVLWDDLKAPIDLQPFINARTELWQLEIFRAPSSRREIRIRYFVVPPKPQPR